MPFWLDDWAGLDFRALDLCPADLRLPLRLLEAFDALPLARLVLPLRLALGLALLALGLAPPLLLALGLAPPLLLARLVLRLRLALGLALLALGLAPPLLLALGLAPPLLLALGLALLALGLAPPLLLALGLAPPLLLAVLSLLLALLWLPREREAGWRALDPEPRLLEPERRADGPPLLVRPRVAVVGVFPDSLVADISTSSLGKPAL